MQFHLDGFATGDPAISPVAAGLTDAGGAVPAEVDVLIVGSGPAGLTLATQLSRFPDIEVAIVERNAAKLALGQADGIACRTMEMFQAFGFAERVLKESYWVNETSFWRPDPADRGRIVRGGRIRDTEEGLSEFPHVILNQARIHDFYLDAMATSPRRATPYYGRRLVGLAVDPAADHPVTVRLASGDAEETVRARFVVGCDGARSAVRRELGYALTGDSANQAWGVMDVLAVTDFPDIRLKAAVHSAAEGSILVIPREGGYLVRLYIELDELAEGERVASRSITVDQLIERAQRILRPYAFAVKEVAWWSIYEIGQRLCDRFDDLPADAPADAVPRVFIAGDACHTHSPKAGQGMNVSMQDGFNLGWKLAAVARGRCRPALLRTYSAERRAIAQELIDFDRAFAAMFSASPREGDDDDGIDPAEFQDYFVRQGRFTAGTATRYAPSAIVAAPARDDLAKGFPVGMRFHSAPVIRLADARPIELGHCIAADGRWRLMIFADEADPASDASHARALCDWLASDPASPVRRYTAPSEDIDAAIDVRCVFRQPNDAIEVASLPSLLRPAKGRYGLIDYEKAFCADPRAGDLFALRGIDRGGCVVVVRPDQYVAAVMALDDRAPLAAFFDGFMLPVSDSR